MVGAETQALFIMGIAAEYFRPDAMNINHKGRENRHR
jgi:hypothetical protein